MKKIYSLISVLALAAGTASAQTGFEYGYCSDNISSIGSDAGVSNYWMAAAFQMTDADVERFDGCEITGVSIGFGSGRNKDLTIFFADALNQEPTATYKGRVRPSQWNDIELTTPVKIEKGKPFYVGYKYNVTNSTAKPVGVDGNTVTYSNTADFVSLAEEESGLTDNWRHYGESFGNVCIRVFISGDNISENNCVPQSLDLPSLAHPGKPFDFTLNFTNASSAAVNSVQVVYKLGEDPEKTIDYTFSSAVEANGKGQVKITDSTEQDSFMLPVSARITKVNGNPNDMADMLVNATLVCTDGLFERKMVVEKYTGVNCQYCPLGIVAFEYMNEHYYGKFIGIGIQNYTGDPMYCSSYNSFLNWMAPSGAPKVMVNRNRSLTSTAEKGALESAFKEEYTDACETGVFASWEKSSSSNAIDATGTVKVAHDVTGTDLALTFVITEDKVGPYNQMNGYSSSTGCPEWADKPQRVSMKFDDVARYIYSDWDGIEGSVPADMKAGEEYPYTVKGLSLGNTEQVKNACLVVLLLDKTTGQIVNADRVYLDPNRQPPVSGIGNVQDEAPCRVFTTPGAICYQGESQAEVYGVSGMYIGTLTDGASLSVVPGIYVVRTPGFAYKVAVK